MSKILIDEATVKLAQNVLKGVWKGGFSYPPQEHISKAIIALQEALAQPQQERTWVNLAHDEYDAICDKHSTMSDFNFLADIEAKLKEKNNGN